MSQPQPPIRVCIILGTRPEAIKLAPVIQQFVDWATQRNGGAGHAVI
jgi:hypothetical protein